MFDFWGEYDLGVLSLIKIGGQIGFCTSNVRTMWVLFGFLRGQLMENHGKYGKILENMGKSWENVEKRGNPKDTRQSDKPQPPYVLLLLYVSCVCSSYNLSLYIQIF